MDCRHSIIKKENSGFILIELIVASVLVSITAGVVLTIFHIFNTETTQMLMNAKLQVRGEIILEEIARNTRLHHNVRCPYDTYNESLNYANVSTKHISFYTSDDVNNSDTIYFIKDTLQYEINRIKKHFRIGKDVVTIIPIKSEFILNKGNQLTVKIELTDAHQGMKDTLTLHELKVRCRN